MAAQFATKMGAEVTVVTTSPGKEQDARRFGAKDVFINRDGADWSKYKRAFDFILQYGQMTTVLNRPALAGSNTGGIRETQDMLEFCALQHISRRSRRSRWAESNLSSCSRRETRQKQRQQRESSRTSGESSRFSWTLPIKTALRRPHSDVTNC